LFAEEGDYNVIIETAIKYGIVLVFSLIFNVTQTWLLQKTGQSIIHTVRKELYTHIQSLSCRYFDLTPVGKLVTRVTNDVEALNEMYSGILVRLFRNIVKIIGLAIVMIIMDWKLALFSFILLPVQNYGVLIMACMSTTKRYLLSRVFLTFKKWILMKTIIQLWVCPWEVRSIWFRPVEKDDRFH